MMGRINSRSISTKLESMQKDFHNFTHGSPSTLSWLTDSIKDLRVKEQRCRERLQKQAELLGEDESANLDRLEAETKYESRFEDCTLAELHKMIWGLQEKITSLQGIIHRQERKLKPR
mmetsp:Transcript_31730/g.64180  ORF Transcript_31730/g.64180 Transcript_31730/m.64180 type:complete len:118 (-) Transcript_31730:111-464(-)